MKLSLQAVCAFILAAGLCGAQSGAQSEKPNLADAKADRDGKMGMRLDPRNRRADLTDLSPIADDSADAVWAAHCVEHLYEHEVPIALAEFRRVLRESVHEQRRAEQTPRRRRRSYRTFQTGMRTRSF